VRLVIGAFATLSEAEAAARALLEAGHRPDVISAHGRIGGGRVLLADRVALQAVGDPARLVSRAERARAWAAVGAVVGAAFAALALFIAPSFGVDLLAAAPLSGVPAVVLALIVAAALGAALGALARRTDGLPHEHASRYGVRLDQGDTVLSVRTAPGGEARAAQELLGMHGAVFAHVTRGRVEPLDVAAS
jgi:hypothetical protein